MKIILFLMLLFSLNTWAQLRCDCSKQMGSCNAEVSYVEGLVELTTDTRSCAQVLFYIDGQPYVRLVTDGRDAHPRELEEFEKLDAGDCRVCKSVQISQQQRATVVQQCAEHLLMSTVETKSCIADCSQIVDVTGRARCEHNCQRFSRCLDENCVASLSKQLKQCERKCDRELQSSMAIDMEAFEICQKGCEEIKAEIDSCPVL